MTGNELTPLGTTDFSAYLIKRAPPIRTCCCVLPQGSDMVNCLKQIAQFGIGKQIHIAGLQQELESLEAMPPEARVGIWMFEWYWKQPGVPSVEKFVADIRKVNSGKVPTARHWFGYTSVHTLAAVANREKESPTQEGSPRRSPGSNWRTTSSCSPTSAITAREITSCMTSSFVGEALSRSRQGIPKTCSASIMSSRATRPPPRKRDRLHGEVADLN
ncbi:ABC transporter substrate-binding protein [Cupriavidus basilensis]